MTKHFRPDNVVQKRFRGRGARRWTDPSAYRTRRAAPLGPATAGLVLVAAALAGLAASALSEGGNAAPARADRLVATHIPFFGYCEFGGGTNCVVDGDTFYFGDDKVRIANIDAPETHPPRCAAEARLGEAATHRLRDLLNAGPVTLSSIDRDEDVYGRKLRNVAVSGADVGSALVSEGLARDFAGGRKSWCG